MRCKPGDLAVGISATPQKSRNIGTFVRIIRASETLGVWEVKALSSFYAMGKLWPPGTKATAHDKRLRPIRPGETPEESIEAMRLLNEVPQGVPA